MKTKRQCFFKYIFYKLFFNRRKARLYKQKISMFKNNNIVVSNSNMKNVNINTYGKNNDIVIKDSIKGRINIYVFGDNNTIFIDDGVYAGKLDIEIGQNHKNFGPVHDCNIKIGKKTSFESTTMIIKNSKANITVGDNCMFACNIMMYHTDSHPVFDFKTGKIINIVKDLVIGNHVWVGNNATILKNTHITDDCVVGWGSVVSGKFDKKHCAIAGNPAKIIKNNITWQQDGSKGYVQNEKN